MDRVYISRISDYINRFNIVFFWDFFDKDFSFSFGKGENVIVKLDIIFCFGWNIVYKVIYRLRVLGSIYGFLF